MLAPLSALGSAYDGLRAKGEAIIERRSVQYASPFLLAGEMAGLFPRSNGFGSELFGIKADEIAFFCCCPLFPAFASGKSISSGVGFWFGSLKFDHKNSRL